MLQLAMLVAGMALTCAADEWKSEQCSVWLLCRHHIALGGLVADLVRADERFEIATPPRFALTCFRLKVIKCSSQVCKHAGKSCDCESLPCVTLCCKPVHSAPRNACAGT